MSTTWYMSFLSPEASRREAHTLKHLANINNIEIDINRMIRRKIIKKDLDLTTSLLRCKNNKNKEKWIRIPYLGRLSFELGWTLHPFHFRATY